MKPPAAEPTVNNRAQAALLARGIGAARLGRELKISKQAASRILRHGIAPRTEHREVAALAFGFPVGWWGQAPGAEPEGARVWRSQGQAALVLCASPVWESSPPRLWSTTPAAVAAACGVTEPEVDDWASGSATPTRAQQEALARVIDLPADWWQFPPPANETEASAVALFMGLRAPTPAEIDHARSLGVSPDIWSRPAPRR